MTCAVSLAAVAIAGFAIGVVASVLVFFLTIIVFGSRGP